MIILCAGGGGYVGSRLVPALLNCGHNVTVLDTFMYGDTLESRPGLTKLRADIRGNWFTKCSPATFDAVVHLACISNDPSFELDPSLGKSVNYDATVRLVNLAKDAGVERFIYASSSSVYGVKPDGIEVTEDLPLEPLTDYSKYKALAEEYVLGAKSKKFQVTIFRPATVCGYSPRLRLDVVVNALTAKAYYQRTIPVMGGTLYRPNLHIQDMVRAYLSVLDAPAAKVNGQIFNVGAENATVMEIAQRVQAIAGGSIVERPTDDKRSYSVNSDKIARVLGFRPQHTIEDAVNDLVDAFAAGKVRNWEDPQYYNIRQMQACHIL